MAETIASARSFQCGLVVSGGAPVRDARIVAQIAEPQRNRPMRSATPRAMRLAARHAVAPGVGFDQGIGNAGKQRCRLDRKAEEGRKALERRDVGVGKTALPVGHPARVEAVHLADRPIFGGEAVNGRYKAVDRRLSHNAGRRELVFRFGRDAPAHQ